MTQTQDTNEILIRIYSAVDYLSELPGQDRGLLIEMSQQMISDLIVTGNIKPMIEYVKRYCDVIDNPEHAIELANDI